MHANFRQFLVLIISMTFVLSALFSFSTQAFAWGRDGHTAIGVLATKQLQPGALRELKNMINPLTSETIQGACSWPDVLRDTEEGAWSAPLHYVNIPRGDAVYTPARDCPVHAQHRGNPERPERYCVTEAIKHYAVVLGNRQKPRQQREQAFAWLCHLVGDLHQPLHAGFADDRGGNNFVIVFENEEINLHGLWDFELINTYAGNWRELVDLEGSLPVSHKKTNWMPEWVDEWTNESHQLAKTKVYPSTTVIDDIYQQRSWELLQRQLTRAASRLALIINSVLQETD